jgi:hypothetical protein
MAKFADILQAIRKEIVRLRVIEDIDRVILVARRTTVPNLVGDKDILIRVNPTQVVTSVEGEGRYFTKIRRLIEVIPRVRLALDEVGRDANWLMNEELGIIAFEDAIIDALQLFQPTNTAEDAFLIVEPMRLVSMTIPEKANEPNSKWGSSVQSWEIMYQQDLDQSRQ